MCVSSSSQWQKGQKNYDNNNNEVITVSGITFDLPLFAKDYKDTILFSILTGWKII